MKTSLLTSLLVAVSAAALSAAPTSFDFKDPKGVNAVSFKLDSLLEPIAGNATGVTGTVLFDPANPGATSGKIEVATNTLTVTNDTMTEHMRGDKWLDAAKHPAITFELGQLSDVKTAGDTTTAIATGKLTIKGVTKELTTPVRLRHIAGAFGKRINKPEVKGDLLVVYADFKVNRADYGIQPGQSEDKVGNEIGISLALVGGAPQA
jgi:polyisoprenoid-binding protein YceI